MDDRYASALAAAAASKANLGNSPNGNSSEMTNLQNLAQVQFAAGNAGNAMSAFGADASATASREEAQQKAGAAAAEAEEKKKEAYDKILKELQDPKNYRQELNDKGGYDFYNPMGDKISVQEYSQVTDRQIADILKDSKDGADQTFQEDYKDLMSYGRALQGNEEDVKKFREDKKYSSFIEKYKDKAYSDVVGDFQKNYAGYFQPKQLDSMPSKDMSGRNITQDTISADGKSQWYDWLRNRQTVKGLNYR